jgi:hypothetical protein
MRGAKGTGDAHEQLTQRFGRETKLGPRLGNRPVLRLL